MAAKPISASPNPPSWSAQSRGSEPQYRSALKPGLRESGSRGFFETGGDPPTHPPPGGWPPGGSRDPLNFALKMAKNHENV